MTDTLLDLPSKPNLKTASEIDNEATGTNKLTKFSIISIIPYSDVVKKLV